MHIDYTGVGREGQPVRMRSSFLSAAGEDWSRSEDRPILVPISASEERTSVRVSSGAFDLRDVDGAEASLLRKPSVVRRLRSSKEAKGTKEESSATAPNTDDQNPKTGRQDLYSPQAPGPSSSPLSW